MDGEGGGALNRMCGESTPDLVRLLKGGVTARVLRFEGARDCRKAGKGVPEKLSTNGRRNRGVTRRAALMETCTLSSKSLQSMSQRLARTA
mmetsp:Transcript_43029/g.84844  ORF Transcript_43029/g.84844 Transcript_43029/m.84844 type:complete len:91 (-) Transcript_43029:75-347(-)